MGIYHRNLRVVNPTSLIDMIIRITICCASGSRDSLNNIDDEFNVGYYDKLTQEGITKNGIMGDAEYPFVSKRFDNLEDGDRNKTFMHPMK